MVRIKREGTLFRLVHLRHLDLSDNDFNYSQIPPKIGELSQLRYLNLSLFVFFGEIPPQFSKLSKLLSLDLSFQTDSVVNPLQLKHSNLRSMIQTYKIGNALRLDDVTIQSTLPDTFTNLTSLQVLSLYNSELYGEFPMGVFHFPNLKILNLRFNPNLNGRLPEFQSSSLTKLELGETGFYGTLPVSIGKLSSSKILLVSQSSLKGEISPSICNLKSLLLHLDLSFNNLSGHVPSCIGNFSRYLEILDLKGNKLSGLIPQTYLMGNILQMIDFSNNNFQGRLPRELINCGWLEYFDISHNNIIDSFPFWLGDLPELKVVALSNNEFHGEIRCSSNMTCTFPKLHIIDLSHNEFSGRFPLEMIQSWKAMKTYNTSQLHYDPMSSSAVYQRQLNVSVLRDIPYSFTMSNKGHIMVYEKLQNFYSLIVIDISSNKISGEIPKVIGELKGLVLLNLSNNNLVGSIPSSLGKLSNLEALDLSLNNLSGKIPQQLTQLTFLEFFNVSFNNLAGPIPQNKHFSTFQGDSFEGNKGLCGDQLLKKCLDHARHSFPPLSSSDDDNDSESFFEIEWKVSLIGYIGGLVAGVALGTSYSSQVIRWLKRLF
ncbi:receptor-like protein 9DC3 [Vicia villosa]|uniref:receptor-like protein 9DC3 n=1 Tax=Vicia villosa TaxID=3911 RepID=UPI00273B4D1C|nr:receptor-like protein 9DC3 [Vicia villosa]